MAIFEKKQVDNTGGFTLGNFSFREIESEQERVAAYRLRYQVFVEEEKFLPAETCANGQVEDPYDKAAILMGAFDAGGNLVGTSRLVIDPQETFRHASECNYNQIYKHLVDNTSVTKRVVNISYVTVAKEVRAGADDVFKGVQCDERAPASKSSGAERLKGLMVILGLYRLAYQKAKWARARHAFLIADSRLQKALENIGIGVLPIGEELSNQGPRRGRPCIVKFRDLEKRLGDFANVKTLGFILSKTSEALSRPQPQAVEKGPMDLLPTLLEEIQRFQRPAAWRAVLQLAMVWTVIVAAIALASWAGHPLVSLAAMFIVASRQNLLGLMVHEQAHRLAFRSRFGDALINLFAGYPLLGVTVEGYARVHLAHHKYYFTEMDPDFRRKSGPEWAPSFSGKRLLGLFIGDLLGINFLRTVSGKKTSAFSGQFKRFHPSPAWLRPAFYLLVAAALSVTHLWGAFFLYWVLPLVTILQAMIRWGALCEHKYNLYRATVQESTPLIELRWWERILFPNLNFSYHVYHHFFQNIPFCHLTKVHRLYQRERLVNERNVYKGYWHYLRSLLAA